MSLPEKLVFDSHTHTYLCKHATGELEQYAEEAIRKNLKGMIFTCHIPVPGYNPEYRMLIDELPFYLSEVERIRKQFSSKLEVLLGIEADYLPEIVDVVREVLSGVSFDYVLGSGHPACPGYTELHPSDNWSEFCQDYFRYMAEAAESGLYDALGHYDVVKFQSPHEWSPEEFKEAITDGLNRIAVTGVAMELNTSGLIKSISEYMPSEYFLKEMYLRNIPIVLGSDAHNPERVGDGFADALMKLKEIGYTEVNYFRARKRCDVNIDSALESLLHN